MGQRENRGGNPPDITIVARARAIWEAGSARSGRRIGRNAGGAAKGTIEMWRPEAKRGQEECGMDLDDKWIVLVEKGGKKNEMEEWDLVE